MVRLIRYGSRFLPVTAWDREQLTSPAGYVEAEVYRIVPGSSVRKRFISSQADLEYRSRVLTAAVKAVLSGRDDITSVVRRHGREYGPRLWKTVEHYVYAHDYGPAGAGAWHQQAPDDCDGCTSGGDTGGPEFGYGAPGNRMRPSPLFLNMPDEGYGHGDEPAGYGPHTPGRGTDSKRTPRLKESNEFPGDTIVNNDQGYWEPFGDEQGVKSPPRLLLDRGPTLGVPIQPTQPTTQDIEGKDNPKKKPVDGKIGGEQDGEFDTKEPPSVGPIDHGTYTGG